MRVAKKRAGFSLLELLAVVTILGVIAAMVIPRVTTSTSNAKAQVHAQNKAEINAAVERYFIDNGAWPATDLSDMLPSSTPPVYDYFPDGLPGNPVDPSTPYTIDATTHRVDTP